MKNIPNSIAAHIDEVAGKLKKYPKLEKLYRLRQRRKFFPTVQHFFTQAIFLQCGSETPRLRLRIIFR